MEDYDRFKEEFENCFQYLYKLTEESFSLMDRHPDIREEMIELWKMHILKFVSSTYKTSEKYHNKDVIKTITKSLMFGK